MTHITPEEMLAANRTLHGLIERATPVRDDNPQILAVGGYTNGELGFEAALAKFRKEALPPSHLDMARVEAAFNREFTQEKPDGKVRR